MALLYRAGSSKKTTQTQLFMSIYSLIAVFVHFNRFIDPTIYSHTNPYNVACSRL